MSVRALTADAQDLLDEIKTQIDQGHIETWSYSQAGDFTHTPTQWKNKAWLRPKVEKDSVDWSPFLRQTVKTHFSSNGELSHGCFTQAVHAGV